MRVKKIIASGDRTHPACITKFRYSNLESAWTDCHRKSRNVTHAGDAPPVQTAVFDARPARKR
ncbi:hypothetical protein CBM2587_B90225 [Cupriavidus taiwanensis]|uniref:Uncharacterized protein n=1 Tax=Cupriavidus taiwanensis TaxID=164546 RepID=A0A975XEE2_9BURK|nr:hypothetical protein CBM2587_B90225 [Cupriavidus taiwanensis]